MTTKPNLIKYSFIGGIYSIIILIILGMGLINAEILHTGGRPRACGDCHADAGGVTTITVTNWPSTYSLSTQYTVTVSVTDSVLTTGLGGVWISTGSVGTLGIGSDIHLEVNGNDLTHTDAGATSWTFTWDSPATNSGTVTLTVYGMVINDGTGNDGDSWSSVTHDSNPSSNPPSAPRNLTATPGNSQVSLNWLVPTSDGGSAITQYNIYRATSSGGSYTNIANPTGLSYTDNTVTNGFTYFYNVTAENTAGESPSSNEASTTPSTIPSAPQSLTAVPGDSQVSLNWLLPSNDGGFAITHYRVYRATTSGGSYTNLANSTGLSYIDNTVTNGITYFYNVTAVTVTGESPSSNEASTTPSTIPSAPQSLTATPGDSQVSLSWLVPSSDGGSAITQYSIYRATTSGGSYTNMANSTGLSYIDNTVTNGITYYYNVTAVNVAGESPSSNEASVTPIGPPTAPQILEASYISNNVILNWSAPINDGGIAITKYRIYRDITIGLPAGSNIANVTSAELSYVDNTVSVSIRYYYVVTAVNTEGESPDSNEVAITTGNVPSVPRNLNSTSNNNQIRLNWTVPTTQGGSAITHYRVYRTTTSGGPYTNIANTTELSYIDNAVTNGVTYYYVITAVNNEGESAYPTEVSATPATIPNVPENLLPISGDAQVSLSWTVPSNDGGSAITHYRVYRAITSGGPYTNIANTTELSYIDNAVTNGIEYYYVLTAVNTKGESGNSTEESATPATVPNFPQSLVATSGDTQVSLTWATPVDDGGSAITHYQVHRVINAVDPYTNIANTTELSYIDTTVTNGVTYHYVITAVNSAGESGYSNEVGATPATIPNIPENLIATSDDTQVLLSWTVPNNDGGSAITHYRVYRATTSGGPYTNIANVTGLSYTDSTVSTGITYYYVVSAVNAEGESGYSTEMNAALTTPTSDQSSSTATTTTSSISTTPSTTTTTGNETPIGLLGFILGIAVIISVRWFRKHGKV
ncbi:MAG: fibronectin type III domain-containing protein [Candidatus Hodarchaeales archaeon]|jgi:fibronectin type 3 domain-containing protein